jgi:hypothetical protein
MSHPPPRAPPLNVNVPPRASPLNAAELQCLVANLIYRKYIKGYIAYKQRVVVLSKTDAFPPMDTVQLADPFG